MVKNTTGGGKTKGQARKFINDSKTNHKALRISQDPLEVYSQVIKNLGNGMCHVLCIDNITRLCHIRGKFRGRGKRDNFIGVGSWVLVGLREWEIGKEGSKLSNCDLLEVYSDHDKEMLKKITTIDWSSFVANDNKTTKTESKEEFAVEFTEETGEEYNEIITDPARMNQIQIDDEIVDIDDI